MSQERRRPRALSFVTLDLENLYKALEVSPQATIAELKSELRRLRTLYADTTGEDFTD